MYNLERVQNCTFKEYLTMYKRMLDKKLELEDELSNTSSITIKELIEQQLEHVKSSIRKFEKSILYTKAAIKNITSKQ